jgi:hypothetical protein
MLDALPGWMAGQADLPPADWSRAGMSGHSYGALTTQVMMGQLFPDEAGRLVPMKESRFRAGILYSPVPVSHLTAAAPEDIYGGIDRPLLHMTGTADESPLESFGMAERRAVFDFSGGPDQDLVILKDGDHMVFTGSRGQLGENPKRELQESLICRIALAWWNAWLKDDAVSLEWLRAGGPAALAADEVESDYRRS